MITKHQWTKQQAHSASIPNFGKKYIGNSELFKHLGEIKNKKILELGCGNGYWLELMAKRGAICFGVEISKEQINLAQQKSTGITYIRGDITALGQCGLPENYFDIVLIEHVLLEIPTLKKIKKIINSSHSLLNDSGIIVISDLHPVAPSLGCKKIKTASAYNYFASGSIVQVESRRIDGGRTIYRDYHWTLEDLASSLTESGFKIVKISEPRPTLQLVQRHPELAYRRKIPMSLWIKAIK